MKIIHISDTHLLGEDKANLYGIDPASRLKRAIKSIHSFHSDAKCIVITGDLIHNCDTNDGYMVLKKIIKKSDIPIYPILGNHDNRVYFSDVFPEFVNDGFVQYTKKAGKRVLIFLDTIVEDRRYGKLCDIRIKWLKAKLDKHKKVPVYIFMHHHPVISGLYEMDHMANFRSQKEFWDLLGRYDNIKHITFGHLHRILHIEKNGISLHSTRSTTFQVAYRPDSKIEYLTNKEKPTYAVMEIRTGEMLRINHHEFLDEKHIFEDGTRSMEE